jgi:hypothetical protein
MAKLIMLAVISVLATAGQTMNIANTVGAGKKGVFGSSNTLVMKNFTTTPFTFGSVYYGANDRVDIYAGASTTTVLGQTQNAVFGGANVTVFKSRFVSGSSYTLVSTPLNKRGDASPATVFTAAIVSKTISETSKVIPYTGYSATIPIGNAEGKLFTAPSTVHNIPVGLMIPKGKMSYFVEYNYGRTVQTVGIGVSFTP